MQGKLENHICCDAFINFVLQENWLKKFEDDYGIYSKAIQKIQIFCPKINKMTGWQNVGMIFKNVADRNILMAKNVSTPIIQWKIIFKRFKWFLLLKYSGLW